MRRNLTHSFIAAIAAGAGAPIALAQVSWENPSGGSYHIGANWSSMAVPGPSDRVEFNLADAYTVDFSAAATNERLRVRNGQVTFDLGGATYTLTLTTSDSAQIGLLSNEDAMLTILNGQVQTHETVLGQFGSSKGELIVDGAAARWDCAAGMIVGASGEGALRALNGAQVTCVGMMIVGGESGSDGLVEISGEDSHLSIGGSLSIGPSTFSFIDGDAGSGDARGFAFSEGRVDLAPGAMITASSVIIGPNGSLQGAGVIDAPMVSNSQGLLRVRPGEPLRIEGEYFDTQGALVEIEIGGATPGLQHGVLDVAGQFSPQGNLMVTLVNDYVPNPGAAFTIVMSSSFGSLFNAIMLPDLPFGREWVVQYSADTLTLLVEGESSIPADLNGDGRVNAQDLSILLGSWGFCPDPPAECIADINNDGRVNAQDLAVLLSFWGFDSN
ncbi:MAG: hypothetical protein EA376_07410 [Phycisphaeraceae bacterium]|nr:MAG: hypothetical protein EA376_07410 [Phycisphaeraceae bacterium]